MLMLVVSQSIRKKSFYNPHLFYWVVTIYAVLIPAANYYPYLIQDEVYNLLYLLASLGACAAFLLIPIQPESRIESRRPGSFLHPLIFILALSYLGYLWLIVLTTVIEHGGVINALVVSRLDIYLKEGITGGKGVATLLLILPEMCFYLLVGFVVARKRIVLASLLVASLVIFYVFTANTRLPIIFPLVAFFALVARLYFEKHLKIIIPISLVGGLIFIVAFSVIGSYLRNGQIEALDLSGELIFDEASRRSTNQLGYYEWVYDLYRSVEEGKVKLGFGYDVALNPIISFIPRALWPEKPLTSSSNVLTEEVYPGRRIGDGEPIHTFLLIGEGYWQLSWLGAFVAPFIFIFLVSFVAKLITRVPYSGYWQAYFVVSCVPFVRAELPLVKSLLTVACIIIVSILYRIHYKGFRSQEALSRVSQIN